MTTLAELHEKWSREAEYRKAFERLRPEYEVARALIKARTPAGFTQAQLACADGDDAIGGRAVKGRVPPSTWTLEKVARAAGTRLRTQFDPA